MPLDVGVTNQAVLLIGAPIRWRPPVAIRDDHRLPCATVHVKRRKTNLTQSRLRPTFVHASTDPDGVKQSVEITAGSLFEAAIHQHERHAGA